MPIINPWMIYLIDLVDGLSMLLFFMGAIMGLVGVFVYFIQITEEATLESFPTKRILICSILIGSLVMLIITTLLPSSKTLTKMVIAQNITVERVDVAKEVIEKVYEDILNVMEARR